MENVISNGATLVVVDAGQLRNEMRELFREVVDEVQAARDADAKARAKETELLTVGDVCEMLHVCKATLWRWNKDNLLPVVKIGNKAFYRMSDVERLKGGAA